MTSVSTELLYDTEFKTIYIYYVNKYNILLKNTIN